MSVPRLTRLSSLLALAVTVGCSTSSAPDYAPSAERAPSAAVDAAPAVVTGGASVPAATLDAMASSRRIVRTGTLVVEVADANAAARAAERIADAHGGYPAGLQAGRDYQGRRQASIVVRVAPDGFLDAMAALRALGTTESESVSTQDVSREYADLQARLSSKRAAAERMRALMGSRTAKLEEVLDAEAKLSAILEQVEQLEGQLRFQDQQVALSTITATLHEAGSDAPVTAAAAPTPFFAPAREALRTGRDHLATLVGAAVYFAVVAGPWLALLGLAGLLALRMRRRATRVGAAG